MKPKKFNIIDILFGDYELTTIYKRILSLLLIITSLLIGFKEYTKEFYILGYHFSTFDNKGGNFIPDLISTIIAIFLIMPLYARNIIKFKYALFHIIALFCNIALAASISKIIGLNTNPIFGINSQSLLIIAILFNWIGMRVIAGLNWIFLLIVSFISIYVNNITMGIYGYIYISCAFVGLLLQAEINPNDLLQVFKKEFYGYSNTVRSDIEEFKTATKETINTVKKTIS